MQKSAPKVDTARAVDDKTPVYRNIHISNLQATTKRAAGLILGLPESQISNVILENVQIAAATKGLTVKNAKGVQFKNVHVTCTEGTPVVVENAQVEGIEGGEVTERK